MDKNEFITDMVNFLNERGLYQDFIDWNVERGFTSEEIEKVIEEAEL